MGRKFTGAGQERDPPMGVGALGLIKGGAHLRIG